MDRIVENGIDTDFWNPGSKREHRLPREKPAGRRWVGFVGRASPEKGPEEFVRVAALLADGYPDVDFVLAGQGEALGSTRSLAAKLGLLERVHFFGELDKTQLHGLYNALELLLAPSRTEGLPNNLLEACAMEVPIVATRVGGVPEVLRPGDNGILVRPGDLQALARAVGSLLDDRELARQLGHNGRVFAAARYSVQAHVEKMSRYYLDVFAAT